MATARPTRSKTAKAVSTVRIIGGQWRGRRVPFLDLEHLRPTPDRVRETLFNWLSGHCPGAHVLDAFAGSGVLGLEALSRGAAHAVFIEQSAAMAAVLQTTLRELNCAQSARVRCADAIRDLAELQTSFDLIFCDPPYRQDLLEPFMQAVQDLALLKPQGFLYVEQPKGAPPQSWPNFAVHRRLTAGQVDAFLLRWSPLNRD